MKTVLPMIVYTSGYLHLGHARSYTACDAIHRGNILRSISSRMPFGYDAHGLPTEIKAREEGLHPLVGTKNCIAAMSKTLKEMNFLFSSEKLNTSDPSYYLMQQEIFIKLYENNIISSKKSFVFGDPVAKTTLANEQVRDGIAERTGAFVEEKQMKQGFFNLPFFARAMQEELDLLDGPEEIKKIQKNGINFKEGIKLDLGKFTIKINPDIEKINYFEANLNLLKDLNGKIQLADKEFNVLHNKDINEEILIAHATKEEGIKIKDLLEKYTSSKESDSNLREWCISRQRSFGSPIPAMECNKCGTVVHRDLISINPLEDSNYEKDLSCFKEWRRVKCPICSAEGLRDPDTLDVLFDSSWYPIGYSLKDLGSLPVDVYIGGKEHASGHLIYIRAMFRALNKIGYPVPKEPISKFYCNGMINNPVYRDKENNYVYPDELIGKGKKAFTKEGLEVEELETTKMSKSKKNVIRLDKILQKYSSDEIRLAILSDYPLNKDYSGSWEVVKGVRKNLRRIKNFLQSESASPLIRDTEADKLYSSFSFNKVIAHAFTILNGEKNSDSIGRLAYTIAPIAPEVVREAGIKIDGS